MLLGMKYLILALMICLATASQAAVYQWQDASGKTQFGDNPPPGVTAEPVQLPELNTVPSAAPADGNAPATDPAAAAMPPVQPYTRMAITSPTNGQTIRTDTGRLAVTVNLNPPLQKAAGHSLVAIAGGKRIQGSGNTIAILAGRGTHQLQAAVVDAAGNIVARTRLITFDIRPDTRLPVSRELQQIQGIQPAN